MHAEQASSGKLHLSFHWLLSIYAIVPALLAVVLVDSFFFDNALRPFVSVNLTTAFFYLVFFELPHIFASFVTFADREYLRSYRKKILYQLPVVLGASILITAMNPEIGVALVVGYTLYHVVSQQTGIAKMMIGAKHWLHTPWRMSAVVVTIAIQLYLLKLPFLNYIPLTYQYSFFWAIVLLFVLVSAFIYMQTKSGIGKKYFAATTLMLLSGILFFLLDYVFFSIFVLRFSHDITAFAFYITHDVNRNAGSFKNEIYRLLAPLKIPVFVLVPAIGMLIAYIVRYELNIYTGVLYAGIIINFTHYYFEGFMWRRDSPHRAQLAFAP